MFGRLMPVAACALVACASPGIPLTPGGHVAGPTTLSLFAPGRGTCTWRIEDPVTGERRELAKLPTACGMPTVSWGPGFARAFVTTSDGWHFRGFLVDVATGAFERVPPPDDGAIDAVGFTPDGTPVALSLHLANPGGGGSGGTVTFGGLSFAVPPATAKNKPAISVAYGWDGGAWTRREIAVTDAAAGGVELLDSARRLGPRSALALRAETGPLPVTPGPVSGLLDAATVGLRDPKGAWGELAPGTFVWFAAPSGSTGATATPVLVFAKGGVATVAPGLPSNTRTDAAIQARDTLVLVTGVRGEGPRLYDAATQTLRWSDPTATGVTFLPQP